MVLTAAENKSVECYSVSVSGDGSRLASGGLDGNVKIWDTHTILQFKAIDNVGLGHVDERLLPPVSQRRPLCSMSRHNGVVTSVKFSPDGRFLASGSDDKIVLIWEKDESAARGAQFGSEEQDLEHWTVRKRLVAHENDIQDICWSPDGLLLVTVGLDRSIIIWSGTTFERIKRYDIHQSMVKGIVFDPANKFFATASDDRTVRIFRYSKKLYESVNNYEFQMEHVVFDPFKKSPLTSYFRRMSWSPDGQNIAVPNATNGPVPSVAIIKRGNWSTDISLIGHEAPCEVCSFSPRLFEIDDDARKDDRDFNTILATGGQDRTLAIWSTYKSKPLVVAADVAMNSITDICWTPDGQTLYFSSKDGYITCVSFDEKELGKVVSPDLIDSQLNKYGTDRDSTIFPESVDQLVLEEKAKQVIEPVKERTTPTPKPQVKEPPKPSLVSTPVQSLTPKQVNKLTQSITMKNGKKRVAPLLVSASSNTRNALTNIPTPKVIKKVKASTKVSHTAYFIPRSGLSSAVRGLKKKVLDHNQAQALVNDDQDNDNDDMAIDINEASNTANLAVSTLRKQKSKIKKQLMEARYPSSFRYVTTLSESLFNHSSLIQHEISQIVNLDDLENSNDLFTGTGATADTTDEDLIFAVIVAGVHHYGNSMYDIEASTKGRMVTNIEVRNGPSWPVEGEEADFEFNDKVDFQDPTTVIVTNNLKDSERKYTLYYPFRIQHVLPVVIDGVLVYYVLVSFYGTVHIIFAESGSSVCPSMELGESVVLIKHRREWLMAVTSSGLVHVWKLPDFPAERALTGHISGVSLAPIVNSGVSIESQADAKRPSTKHVAVPNIKSIDIDEHGRPLVLLTNSNDVYNYNSDLMAWMKVVDPWYFKVVDIAKGEPSVLEHYRQLSACGFEEDTKRSRTSKYVITAANQELEDVMTAKYVELKNCAL